MECYIRYQQHAIGFKDVGIQLWELHKYNNGLLIFNEVKSTSTKEPLTTVIKSKAVNYTEDDHLKSVDDKTKELYSELKVAILAMTLK